MKARKWWQLRQLLQEIWVRVSLFSLLGLLTALCGLWFNRYIPNDWAKLVGVDAVDAILTILASSMLAVTTFSLNTMLGAYNSVSTNVTPRATQLLIQDQTTQNVLSSFVGAFVFSIVGIISLQAGVYGSRGKVVIFVVTLAVVVMVVVTLLRWINHLMQFGRFGEATQRVENVTARALKNQAQDTFQKAQILSKHWQPPQNSQALLSPKNGYIQYLDVDALSQLCVEKDQFIFCQVQPGQFVTVADVLAYSVGLDKKNNNLMSDAFVLAVDRSFEQDPRFGLRTLSEIASRALSPAVNDPGTAINVITRGTRLLTDFTIQRQQSKKEDLSTLSTISTVKAQVFILEPTDEDLFDEFFTPIARDGAALVEVMLALLHALAQLHAVNQKDYGQAVCKHTRLLIERADHQMALAYDRNQLIEKAHAIFAQAPLENH